MTEREITKLLNIIKEQQDIIENLANTLHKERAEAKFKEDLTVITRPPLKVL